MNNIETIYSTHFAFAALNYDGTVVSWGCCNAVCMDNLVDIKTITCTDNLFIALKNNGSVVIWGDFTNVTSYDCYENIYPTLPPDIAPILHIFSNNFTFILLCEDNKIYNFDRYTNKYKQIEHLTDVNIIYNTSRAFAALNNDQTVYTWGSDIGGGDSSEVQKYLTNITHIISTDHSFAAVKDNNDVVVWGCNHGNTFLNDIYTNIEKIFCTKNTLFLLNEFY